MRFLGRRNTTILMYHGVTDQSFEFPVWTQVSAERFDAQIGHLIRRGCHFLSMQDVLGVLQDGRDFPADSVALTFDDGFANNASHAFPILQKYNVPATIYLATDLIGTTELIWTDRVLVAYLATSRSEVTLPELGKQSLRSPAERHAAFRQTIGHLKGLPAGRKNELLGPIDDALEPNETSRDAELKEAFRLMSWDDARRLQGSGLVEFGGHTSRHEITSRTDPADLGGQLRQCKEKLELELGRPALQFAYPNGTRDDYNENVIQVLQSHGWSAAVTTVPGRAGRNDKPFELPRIGIGSGVTVETFDYACSNIQAWRSLGPVERTRSTLSGIWSGRFS